MRSGGIHECGNTHVIFNILDDYVFICFAHSDNKTKVERVLYVHLRHPQIGNHVELKPFVFKNPLYNING